MPRAASRISRDHRVDRDASLLIAGDAATSYLLLAVVGVHAARARGETIERLYKETRAPMATRISQHVHGDMVFTSLQPDRQTRPRKFWTNQLAAHAVPVRNAGISPRS